MNIKVAIALLILAIFGFTVSLIGLLRASFWGSSSPWIVFFNIFVASSFTLMMAIKWVIRAKNNK